MKGVDFMELVFDSIYKWNVSVITCHERLK